jgi:hypothetical protein
VAGTAAIITFGALMMAACRGGGGDQAQHTPTPSSGEVAASLVSLARQFRSADFYFVFEVAHPSSPYRREQFVWIQSGGLTRWDEAATSNNSVVGLTQIFQGQGAFACSWGTRAHTTVVIRVACGRGSDYSDDALRQVTDFDDRAGQPPPSDVTSAGVRDIDGQTATCYSRHTFASGTICLSAVGEPLEFDIPGLFSASIIERRDQRSLGSLTTQLTEGGQSEDNVPLDSLNLPPLDVIQEYEHNP